MQLHGFMSRLVYICRVKSTNVAPNRGDFLNLCSDFIAMANITSRFLGGISAIHRLTGDLVRLRTFFGREPWFLGPEESQPSSDAIVARAGRTQGAPLPIRAGSRGLVPIRLVQPGLSGPVGLFYFNLFVRSTSEITFGYYQYITHLMKISSDSCGNLPISLSA